MDDLNALPLPVLFQRLVAGDPLDRVLEIALNEDLSVAGDITSRSIIPTDMPGRAQMAVRQAGVVAGLEAIPAVLARFGHRDAFTPFASDGQRVNAPVVIGELNAPLRVILKAERLMLNLMSHLSGIATLTRAFVDEIAGTSAAICDTRKTTPGLRRLEKYAARCGGATVHRLGLYDAALYKDNHLAHISPDQLTQVLSDAVRRVREKHGPATLRFIEVEVDTLEQFERLLNVEPGLIDCILLDNMPTEALRQAVQLRDERSPSIQLEASGGINMNNARFVAETGVNRIAVGAITHSAPALDIGLDMEATSGS